MLRSLYSGIAGLQAHQQMMDVTGNNIANVNTVGFKASSVQFEDTLSQMIGAAGAPQGGQAGTNPAQVGLGVKSAGILTNFAQGSQETTGRSGDMMVQGDGFFVVRSGQEDLYTRAGSFFFDANGTLTTTTGEPVQGWSADSTGAVNTAAKPDDIKMPLGSTIPPKATANITLKGNLSSDAPTDPANPTPDYTIPVKVYDKLGTPSTVVVDFKKNANGGFDVLYPYDTTTQTGTPISSINGGNNLTFTNGKPDVTNFDMTNPDTGDTYKVDITDLTNYSGQSDARVFDADGQVKGTLTSVSYTVDATGEIVGVYSNGLKQTLGRVAMATFKNVQGLEKVGNSEYRGTINSGYAQVGVPGSAGMGDVVNGALEMSNVDLSQEFTNLIVAQRGFQANSRVITTSDEILQELVSLKR